MKSLFRFLVLLASAAALAPLPASATTLLCSQGPTSTKTGTTSWQAIYTCTIPANTVASGHAIRLTSDAFSGGSSSIGWAFVPQRRPNN